MDEISKKKSTSAKGKTSGTKGERLIADTPEELRPREKAMRHGLKVLTDTELMAIVFSTGIKGKGVMALCDEILASYKGHLSCIASTPTADFIKAQKGIGPAKALTFLAGIELGMRAAADAITVERKQIASSQMAYEYMKPHLTGLDHEQFWLLLLNHSLIPIKEVCVGRGGLTMTAVDVKIVVREALLNNSSAMMLFHNHPSGTLRPSVQDEQLTRRIKDACDLLDIRVLDHIVVANHRYYSFHDEGKL